MEENLIEAVKKHEVLYNKSSVLYRNKFKRAAAWDSISKELKIPEDVCQARWRSLRDKFVKKFSETHCASGSAANVSETHWQYREQMEFLREHIKPRRTVTSLIVPRNISESSTEAPAILSADNSLPEILLSEEDLSQDPLSSASPPLNSESNSLMFEVPGSSRKRSRRECDSEAFTEFLGKMTKLAETRFAPPPAQKETGLHDGFFAMVTEIFNDLPTDTVREAKFFIINYLRDQVAVKKN